MSSLNFRLGSNSNTITTQVVPRTSWTLWKSSINPQIGPITMSIQFASSIVVCLIIAPILFSSTSKSLIYRLLFTDRLLLSNYRYVAHEPEHSVKFFAVIVESIEPWLTARELSTQAPPTQSNETHFWSFSLCVGVNLAPDISSVQSYIWRNENRSWQIFQDCTNVAHPLTATERPFKCHP